MQVLIALGIVALIAIMVLVWITVFGTKKSDTTALDSSQTITTPTVSVPQLAPSAVPTTPERSLPDSLHENLPPEIRQPCSSKRFAIMWFPATLPQHLGLCLVYRVHSRLRVLG